MIEGGNNLIGKWAKAFLLLFDWLIYYWACSRF